MLGILCCQLRRYKIDFYTQLTKGELLKLHAKVESNQHIHQRFRHFLEMPFDMVKKQFDPALKYMDMSLAAYFLINQAKFKNILPLMSRIQIFQTLSFRDSFVVFLMAKKLDCLESLIRSQYLQKTFVNNLSLTRHDEILYCLQVIKAYSPTLVKYFKPALIQNTLATVTHSETFIQLSGFLYTQGIPLVSITNKQIIMNHFIKTNITTFKTIYYMHKLSQKLGILMNQQLQNNLRKLIPNLREVYQYSQEEFSFIIAHYSEHVPDINIQNLGVKNYIKFLEFFKTNYHLTPPKKKIPLSVIVSCTWSQFKRILELRLSLEIDSELQLARNIGDYFTTDLTCLSCYIAYLKERNVDEPLIWRQIQRGIVAKLSLNTPDLRLYDSYDIIALMKVFSSLVALNKCSIYGWSRLLKLVQMTLEDQNIFTSLHPKSQCEFLMQVASIIGAKSTQERYLTLTFDYAKRSLKSYLWSAHSISKFTRILSSWSIGDDELWMLLEKQCIKIMEPCLPIAQSKQIVDNKQLLLIAYLIKKFKKVRKGSFEFWSLADQFVTAKSSFQDEQKKKFLQILEQAYSVEETA